MISVGVIELSDRVHANSVLADWPVVANRLTVHVAEALNMNNCMTGQ